MDETAVAPAAAPLAMHFELVSPMVNPLAPQVEQLPTTAFLSPIHQQPMTPSMNPRSPQQLRRWLATGTQLGGGEEGGGKSVLASVWNVAMGSQTIHQQLLLGEGDFGFLGNDDRDPTGLLQTISPVTLRFSSLTVEREFLAYYGLSHANTPMLFGGLMLLTTLAMQLLFTSTVRLTSLTIIAVAWAFWGAGLAWLAMLKYRHRQLVKDKADSRASTSSTSPLIAPTKSIVPGSSTTTAAAAKANVNSAAASWLEGIHGALFSELAPFSSSAARRKALRIAQLGEVANVLLYIGGFMYVMWQLQTKLNCSNLTGSDKYLTCTAALQFEGSAVLLLPTGAVFMPIRWMFFVPLALVALGLFFALRWIPDVMPAIDANYVIASGIIFSICTFISFAYVYWYERSLRFAFVSFAQCQAQAVRIASVVDATKELEMAVAEAADGPKPNNNNRKQGGSRPQLGAMLNLTGKAQQLMTAGGVVFRPRPPRTFLTASSSPHPPKPSSSTANISSGTSGGGIRKWTTPVSSVAVVGDGASIVLHVGLSGFARFASLRAPIDTARIVRELRVVVESLCDAYAALAADLDPSLGYFIRSTPLGDEVTIVSCVVPASAGGIGSPGGVGGADQQQPPHAIISSTSESIEDSRSEMSPVVIQMDTPVVGEALSAAPLPMLTQLKGAVGCGIPLASMLLSVATAGRQHRHAPEQVADTNDASPSHEIDTVKSAVADQLKAEEGFDDDDGPKYLFIDGSGEQYADEAVSPQALGGTERNPTKAASSASQPLLVDPVDPDPSSTPPLWTMEAAECALHLCFISDVVSACRDWILTPLESGQWTLHNPLHALMAETPSSASLTPVVSLARGTASVRVSALTGALVASGNAVHAATHELYGPASRWLHAASSTSSSWSAATNDVMCSNTNNNPAVPKPSSTEKRRKRTIGLEKKGGLLGEVASSFDLTTTTRTTLSNDPSIRMDDGGVDGRTGAAVGASSSSRAQIVSPTSPLPQSTGIVPQRRRTVSLLSSEIDDEPSGACSTTFNAAGLPNAAARSIWPTGNFLPHALVICCQSVLQQQLMGRCVVSMGEVGLGNVPQTAEPSMVEQNELGLPGWRPVVFGAPIHAEAVTTDHADDKQRSFTARMLDTMQRLPAIAAPTTQPTTAATMAAHSSTTLQVSSCSSGSQLIATVGGAVGGPTLMEGPTSAPSKSRSTSSTAHHDRRQAAEQVSQQQSVLNTPAHDIVIGANSLTRLLLPARPANPLEAPPSSSPQHQGIPVVGGGAMNHHHPRLNSIATTILSPSSTLPLIGSSTAALTSSDHAVVAGRTGVCDDETAGALEDRTVYGHLPVKVGVRRRQWFGLHQTFIDAEMEREYQRKVCGYQVDRAIWTYGAALLIVTGLISMVAGVYEARYFFSYTDTEGTRYPSTLFWLVVAGGICLGAIVYLRCCIPTQAEWDAQCAAAARGAVQEDGDQPDSADNHQTRNQVAGVGQRGTAVDSSQWHGNHRDGAFASAHHMGSHHPLSRLWLVIPPWVLFLCCYCAAIFSASRTDNLLGRSRVVWFYVLDVFAFVRPDRGSPMLMWLTGDFWFSLAFAVEGAAWSRTSTLMGHRASNVYGALLNAVYCLLLRLSWDVNRRDVFVVQKETEYLETEIKARKIQLEQLVEHLAPRGMAKELLTRYTSRGDKTVNNPNNNSLQPRGGRSGGPSEAVPRLHRQVEGNRSVIGLRPTRSAQDEGPFVPLTVPPAVRDMTHDHKHRFHPLHSTSETTMSDEAEFVVVVWDPKPHYETADVQMKGPGASTTINFSFAATTEGSSPPPRKSTTAAIAMGDTVHSVVSSCFEAAILAAVQDHDHFVRDHDETRCIDLVAFTGREAVLVARRVKNANAAGKRNRSEDRALTLFKFAATLSRHLERAHSTATQRLLTTDYAAQQHHLPSLSHRVLLLPAHVAFAAGPSIATLTGIRRTVLEYVGGAACSAKSQLDVVVESHWQAMKYFGGFAGSSTAPIDSIGEPAIVDFGAPSLQSEDVGDDRSHEASSSSARRLHPHPHRPTASSNPLISSRSISSSTTTSKRVGNPIAALSPPQLFATPSFMKLVCSALLSAGTTSTTTAAEGQVLEELLRDTPLRLGPFRAPFQAVAPESASSTSPVDERLGAAGNDDDNDNEAGMLAQDLYISVSMPSMRFADVSLGAFRLHALAITMNAAGLS